MNWLCRAISQSNLNVSPFKSCTSILLAIFSFKKLDWYLSPIVSDFKLKRSIQESTTFSICLCVACFMWLFKTFPFPLGLISNHPTYSKFPINLIPLSLAYTWLIWDYITGYKKMEENFIIYYLPNMCLLRPTRLFVPLE